MASSKERIAAVVGNDGAEIQSLFAVLAAAWRAEGIKVVGVIGEGHGLPGRSCNAGFLRDIVSGTPYAIFPDAMPQDTSCHLDTTGVEAACASMLGHIHESDIVILSKFGKLEAMRQGLTAAFEAAIRSDRPLLTTVSDRHRDAWRDLAPHAVFLDANEEAIRTWWLDQGTA